MAPSPDLPERIDRYEILEILGRGAMGEVYLALDPKFDRRIALKVMTGHRLGEDDELDELRRRFVVEGRAAGRLNHPGIVTLYDADSDAQTGWPFLAMEWVDGESLRKRLKRDGPLPVREVVDLGAQVARALAYAHAQGVVHRDIKPANLLLHQDGRVKVADFGVAKLVSSSLTLTGQVLGSPNYMAPEQVRAEPVDGRTDLFALGVVLYEALTGRPAFAAESLAGITFKIVSVDPRPIGIYNAAVTDRLDAVLRKALEKLPGDRFPTGTALADALDEVTHELPDDEPRHATRELALAVGAAKAASAAAGAADIDETSVAVRPPRPAPPRPTPTSTVSTWRGRSLRHLAVLLAVLAVALTGATLVLRPDAHELQDLTRRLGLFDAERASGAESPPETEQRDSVTDEPVDAAAFENTSVSTVVGELPDEEPPIEDGQLPADDAGSEADAAADGPTAGIVQDGVSEPIAEPSVTDESRTTDGASTDEEPAADAAPPRPQPVMAPLPEPARVVLEFENRFRRAYLAAWVDGQRVLVRRLETTGVMPRLIGQIHQFEIRPASGRRTIEVHVSGLSTRVEARGKIDVDLDSGQRRVLIVEMVRARDDTGERDDRLDLRWKTD